MRMEAPSLGDTTSGASLLGTRPRTGTSHESSGRSSPLLTRDPKWMGQNRYPSPPRAGPGASLERSVSPLQPSPLSASFLTRSSFRAIQPPAIRTTRAHGDARAGTGPGDPGFQWGGCCSAAMAVLTPAHQAHADTCPPGLPGPWAGLWPPVCWSLSMSPTLAMLCGCCWPWGALTRQSSELCHDPHAPKVGGANLIRPQPCSPDTRTLSMVSCWDARQCWPWLVARGHPGFASSCGQAIAGGIATRP